MGLLMDIEMITTVVLLVNVGALVFVGIQTRLTRRALALAEKTFRESQRTKEILDLPQGSLMLTLKAEINMWREKLQAIIDNENSIRAQLKKGNKTLGSEYGRESPKGIIIRCIYDNSPGWMQVIYVSAAQYYFHCKGAAFSLLSMPQISDNCVDDLVKTARWGVRRISEILTYIDERLPEWYLECPARISESKFFDNAS